MSDYTEDSLAEIVVIAEDQKTGGYSRDEIESSLAELGYEPALVQNALKIYDGNLSPKPNALKDLAQTTKARSKSRFPVTSGAGGGIALVVGLAAGTWGGYELAVEVFECAREFPTFFGSFFLGGFPTAFLAGYLGDRLEDLTLYGKHQDHKKALTDKNQALSLFAKDYEIGDGVLLQGKPENYALDIDLVIGTICGMGPKGPIVALSYQEEDSGEWKKWVRHEYQTKPDNILAAFSIANKQKITPQNLSTLPADSVVLYENGEETKIGFVGSRDTNSLSLFGNYDRTFLVANIPDITKQDLFLLPPKYND